MWLAGLDAWTHPGSPFAPPEDRGRYHQNAVRSAIARALPRVHVTVEKREHSLCVAWLRRLGHEVDALPMPLGAAAFGWAAVDVFDDIGIAPWTSLARAVEKLARLIEPPGDGITACVEAMKLRLAMDDEADRLWGQRVTVAVP